MQPNLVSLSKTQNREKTKILILQTFAPSSDPMGGSVSTPRPFKLPLPAMETCDSLRPLKLLFNVTIENSLGAIQVLMLPEEDTVGDLIKAALVIYDRDKRRPLLRDTDPNCYDLHYSPYNLQSNHLWLWFMPCLLLSSFLHITFSLNF